MRQGRMLAVTHDQEQGGGSMIPLPGRKWLSQTGSTYPHSAESWEVASCSPFRLGVCWGSYQNATCLSMPIWLAAPQRLRSLNVLSYLGHTFAR